MSGYTEIQLAQTTDNAQQIAVALECYPYITATDTLESGKRMITIVTSNPKPFLALLSDAKATNFEAALSMSRPLSTATPLTERFIILPPNATEVVGSRIPIYLNTHQTFGDGKHPTTQLCAEALSRFIAKQNNPNAIRMLDAGAGTGILSIMAEKSDIGSIDAIDYDHDAIQVLRQNCTRNKCTNIHISQANILRHQLPQTHYTIIAANLLTHVLEKTLDKLLGALTPDGTLLLSGISKQWQSSITARLNTPHNVHERDGWLCIEVSRSC